MSEYRAKYCNECYRYRSDRPTVYQRTAYRHIRCGFDHYLCMVRYKALHVTGMHTK